MSTRKSISLAWEEFMKKPIEKGKKETNDSSLCRRCGIPYPQIHIVSDRQWKFICGVQYDLKCILCKKCMMLRLNR